mgnify:CR=1 FL=1
MSQSFIPQNIEKMIFKKFETSKGELICAIKDEYGDIDVYEKNGRRSLYFGNGVKQSEILTEVPYLPTMEYLEVMLGGILFTTEVSLLYFMGLGGGTLPHYFHHFFPSSLLVVSELRQVVHEIARTCFHFPESNRIKMQFSDGCEFLRTSNMSFDLLFLDVFDADGLSTQIKQTRIDDLILPYILSGGVAVLNLWESDYTQVRQLEWLAAFENKITMLKYRVETSKNIILYLIPTSSLQNCNKRSLELNSFTPKFENINLQKIIRNLEIQNNIQLNNTTINEEY